MAFDKVVDSAQLDVDITKVADAIRERAGTSDKMVFPDGMVETVKNIPSVTELPELTDPASATDLAYGKELIDTNGNPITGTLPVLEDGVTAFAAAEHLVGGTKGDTTFKVSALFSNHTGDGIIARPTGRLGVRGIPTDLLGDAMPEQVLKGVTFTSAAGYLAEGNYEPSEGVNLPTLTNPGTADDLASGRELIDSDGNVVTGTLNEIGEGAILGATRNKRMTTMSDSSIGVRAETTGSGIVRPGATLAINMPAAEFGNAEASQVAKGATFTSAAGLLVEGTHEETGIELPELGDTAAQPTDIAYGKMSYDDEGNLVTGTLGDIKPGDEGRYIFGTNPRVTGDTNLFIEAESSASASPVIHRPGSTATVRISSSAFGTAAAHQVAKGVTFTSAAGLLVEGTHECDTGIQLAPLSNPAGAADIVSGKSLYDDQGNLVPGSLYEVVSGQVMSARDDVTVTENSDGTVQILAKTNSIDAIVRNGAYLRITASKSDFANIFGSNVIVDEDGYLTNSAGDLEIDSEGYILL